MLTYSRRIDTVFVKVVDPSYSPCGTSSGGDSHISSRHDHVENKFALGLILADGQNSWQAVLAWLTAGKCR
jgi:hypothetical protein